MKSHLFYFITIGTLIWFVSCNTSSSVEDTYVFTKEDFLGWWHEADTMSGAHGWCFKDTIVYHSYKDIDTMGSYFPWHFDDTVLYLTDWNKEEYKILYEIINKNELNLTYYDYGEIDKRFYRGKLE